MAKIATIFDASLQKEVDHTLTIDDNGEVLATSVESGHSIKFPSGLDKDGLKKAIAEHKELNEGQEVVSEEELKEREEALAKSQEALEDFEDGEDDEEAPAEPEVPETPETPDE